MQDDIQHDADGANMVDEAADGSEQERKKSGGGADETGAKDRSGAASAMIGCTKDAAGSAASAPVSTLGAA